MTMGRGMGRLVLALLLVLSVAAGGFFWLTRARPAPVLAVTPELRIFQGVVQGGIDSENSSVHVYNGIPYATAKRWQAPGVPPQWGATPRDARAFGPECIQPRAEFASFSNRIIDGLGLPAWQEFAAKRMIGARKVPNESEDCLFVNVRTANVDGPRLQPVMVWLHGGGHQFGSGSQFLYQSNGLVEKGVVLITVNYRLGALGYMAHPTLSEEDGVSGNYGLQDQIAALAWVKNNARAFGGDPENVTVFGESAGAQSVSEIMASPLADGLYHKVILQSGSSSYNAIHLKDSRATSVRPAEEIGAEFISSFAPDSQTAEALRAIPVELIIAAQSANPAFDRYWLPNVDGRVLPRAIGAAIRDGETPALPMLAGYNADEASLYFNDVQSPTVLASPITGTLPERHQKLVDVFGDNLAKALIALYSMDSDATWDAGAQAMLGDEMFGVHMRFISVANADRKAPTWLYQFTRVPPSPKQTLGAYHSSELTFVFDSHPPALKLPLSDRQLTDYMLTYWSNFARTGDPNSASVPKWPAYSSSADEWLELDATPVAAVGLRAQKLDVLEENLLRRLAQISPAPAPVAAIEPMPSGGE